MGVGVAAALRMAVALGVAVAVGVRMALTNTLTPEPVMEESEENIKVMALELDTSARVAGSVAPETSSRRCPADEAPSYT